MTLNYLQLETLIHAIRIYSQDIRMEFGIKNVPCSSWKVAKEHMIYGKELPNHDKIRTLGENETYKYLGILKVDTIKQEEMKDKIQK